MSGIKRDATDILMSRLIRERDDWTCQRCGQRHEPPTTGLHHAHLFTRRSRSTRWDADCGVALCYGCHQWVDSHPAEKELLARRLLGDGRYELLRQKHARPARYRKSDIADIRKHLRSELDRLKMLRMGGKRGPLEVVSPI